MATSCVQACVQRHRPGDIQQHVASVGSQSLTDGGVTTCQQDNVAAVARGHATRRVMRQQRGVGSAILLDACDLRSTCRHSAHRQGVCLFDKSAAAVDAERQYGHDGVKQVGAGADAAGACAQAQVGCSDVGHGGGLLAGLCIQNACARRNADAARARTDHTHCGGPCGTDQTNVAVVGGQACIRLHDDVAGSLNVDGFANAPGLNAGAVVAARAVREEDLAACQQADAALAAGDVVAHRQVLGRATGFQANVARGARGADGPCEL